MTESLSPDALTALLLASAHAIAAEASALGPRARVRPADGAWCANEIIGHLIEAETRGFNRRIRAILADREPVLETWDQPAVAAARDDREKVDVRPAGRVHRPARRQPGTGAWPELPAT